MAAGDAAIRRFEQLLASGRDDALLRFALGDALLAAGEPTRAGEHLERATVHDPNYSAAWKLLGKARLANGDRPGAAAAWRAGIKVAEGRGDVQAAREMRVFARRIERGKR